jgi:endonuclease YncB( thermonuclease family)
VFSLNFKKIVPIVCLLLAVMAFSQKAKIVQVAADVGNQSSGDSELSQSIRITAVKDGDTVKLEDGRDIRFCGIDAPETAKRGKPGQPGGEEAKKFLEKLVQKSNGDGYLIETDRDRYGRTVGEVFLRVPDAPGGEININSEMVVSGNAYFYKQYSKCPNADRFAVAEEIAQKSKAGVWASSGFEKPWDFRRRMK